VYAQDKRIKKAGGETRRRYTEEFKADVVAQCQQEGISIARVALEHRLNANLLRRWIGERQDGGLAGNVVAVIPEPRFVELPAPVTTPPLTEPSPATIQIEIIRGTTKIAIAWPTNALADSALWLREVLR